MAYVDSTAQLGVVTGANTGGAPSGGPAPKPSGTGSARVTTTAPGGTLPGASIPSTRWILILMILDVLAQVLIGVVFRKRLG